jgi:PAS domain-containing protein
MVEEHWLEALVANVPGAIYRCAFAHDWAMEYISQGIEQITGYPASDFVGGAARTYASVIHPDDADPVEREVGACVARREPFTLESSTSPAHWMPRSGPSCAGTP